MAQTPGAEERELDLCRDCFHRTQPFLRDLFSGRRVPGTALCPPAAGFASYRAKYNRRSAAEQGVLTQTLKLLRTTTAFSWASRPTLFPGDHAAVAAMPVESSVGTVHWFK